MSSSFFLNFNSKEQFDGMMMGLLRSRPMDPVRIEPLHRVALYEEMLQAWNAFDEDPAAAMSSNKKINEHQVVAPGFENFLSFAVKDGVDTKDPTATGDAATQKPDYTPDIKAELFDIFCPEKGQSEGVAESGTPRENQALDSEAENNKGFAQETRSPWQERTRYVFERLCAIRLEFWNQKHEIDLRPVVASMAAEAGSGRPLDQIMAVWCPPNEVDLLGRAARSEDGKAMQAAMKDASTLAQKEARRIRRKTTSLKDKIRRILGAPFLLAGKILKYGGFFIAGVGVIIEELVQNGYIRWNSGNDDDKAGAAAQGNQMASGFFVQVKRPDPDSEE